MSIARQLELSTIKLRNLMQRGNGDIYEAGPAILDDIMLDIVEQVRGLEDTAIINNSPAHGSEHEQSR